MSLHQEESVSTAEFESVLQHGQTRGYKPELCRFGMGQNLDTRLWVVGLRHSDSPLILKKTSCSCSFRVNSSSSACRGQQIQTSETNTEGYITKKTKTLILLTVEEICVSKWTSNIPSSWVSASLSTPLSPGCAPHPAPSAFGSHVQSEGGISHSERKRYVNVA